MLGLIFNVAVFFHTLRHIITLRESERDMPRKIWAQSRVEFHHES